MNLSTVFLLLLPVIFAQDPNPLAKYTQYVNTDITPCSFPCVRVGNCGYSTPNPVCNITLIAELCDQIQQCTTFNSNGWLKGCGNVSCGVTFEGSQGTNTYIKNGGVPPPPPPAPPVSSFDDVHYPASEPMESQVAAPTVLSASVPQQWVVVQAPGSTQSVNITTGQAIGNYILLQVITVQDSVVIFERSFSQWGFLSYVSVTSGEIARLRKGTGSVSNTIIPNYNILVNNFPLYYSQVSGGPLDWLGNRILNDTNNQPNFTTAMKYLPPQRDYAAIGAIDPYQKYSVAPDGRIKTADDAIYTTDDDSTNTGPGTLVFDPLKFLPNGHWPATNWSYVKSALVGRFLRVVIVTGYDTNTTNGFEQIAFAPRTELSNSTYIRLRATVGSDVNPQTMTTYAYYNVSKNIPAVPMDPQVFYQALFAEQAFWNATFANAVSYRIPGQEGARQIDTAFGGIVLSASLFVGYMPNYGDGADYWSPQIDRGGSLPFQTIALDQSLLDSNMHKWTADRIGWYFDNYIVMPDGNLTTGDWEDSCPDKYADGLSDYGEMTDLFFRVARSQLSYNTENGTAWLNAHIDQGVALANRSYKFRLNAKANSSPPGTVTYNMIFGSPEHDTCHSPDFYYHNNAWFIRGLYESGKFLRDVCPTYCPQYAALGPILYQEAESFYQDFLASLKLSTTFNNVTGAPYFIPPIATLNMAPFQSMIESVLSEYSNFRYYSELLGSDMLPPAYSNALQDFRETTFGTVSGITRWSDHLDDMPSSYYLAASLRDDRIARFHLLLYGHMANYQGRGTFTATEQLPIFGDANGFWRDYLWSYLEGGIDECIPSIQLPGIGTRWMFVLERYDEDILWLAKGAPRRWFDPSSTGFAIERALTRYGTIAFSVANTDQSGTGEQSTAQVTFTLPPVPLPGTTTTPQLALRLLASDASYSIEASSVNVQGTGVVLSTVDATASIVYVNITQSSSTVSFTVTAKFQ